ncbi:uncharacterized protein B0H18DRAFT_1037596 [Fomitopsis serialis]|uniref:uncharacterized protein n=1 Tax=Fomitopsis serialis TaxID=139415 RepID=UPI002008DFA6|nr:uncharacterized protein B0H18DRAFT_1037596 [Neoantrodia serialis]KAH9916673.1 hypothetical protein B0H18DRAFT_1037596 [Neoantrodia serialis]
MSRVHASRRSQSRRADIFIWWPSTPTSEIMACFSSDIVGSVTGSTLVRWINMISRLGGVDVMEVKRVSWRRKRPFSFRPEPLETIPISDVLGPGDYGCYYMDRRSFIPYSLPFNASYSVVSLEKKKQMFIKMTPTPGSAESLELYNIPDTLRDQASARDEGKCIFTQSESGSSPVDVHWIYPPAWSATCITTLGVERSKLLLRAKGFQDVDNLATMRSDIYKLWHSNAFSVDVDGEYRVRIFDAAAIGCGLPSRLEKIPAGTKSGDFFREHFRHTLCVHFVGGDITADYSHRQVQAFLEEMGLDEFDGEATIEDINLEDERWQTVIGQEILEDVMEKKLSGLQ